MMSVDNSSDDILQELNFDDPIFNLKLTVIPKANFDPKTPAEKINHDLTQYRNCFTIGHINARSLNKNILELKAVIEKTHFDAIAISETWLTRNTPKDRFHINGFNIVRKDRTNKRGGGICLFIRDHYTYKKINVPHLPEMPETMWIEITVGHSKIAIGILYKPPKIPYNTFVQTYDSLLYIYSKYENAILVGDFNVNMLEPHSYDAKALTDYIIDPFGLTQLIKTPTRITEKSKTLIDLMLVNNNKNVLFSGACDAPGISDHFFTYMAYSIKKVKVKPKTIRKRDFRNFDFEGFKKAAEVAHFENIFIVDNIDDKVTILENTISDILDKFAPYRTFKVGKSTSTPWITEAIKAKMDARDQCKTAFNETGNKSYFDQYKTLKNQVTSMMRSSQKSLFNKTINNKVKNAKEFYKAVKKLQVLAEKSNRGSFSHSADKLNETFLLNNNAKIDDVLIDNEIQEMYKNTIPCIHKFAFTAVKEFDVVKTVNSIKTLSEGVDNINVFILKLFINRISTVLTHIINKSFQSNYFPVKWKKAIITPIPKVPIPLTASEYRPIS